DRVGLEVGPDPVGASVTGPLLLSGPVEFGPQALLGASGEHRVEMAENPVALSVRQSPEVLEGDVGVAPASFHAVEQVEDHPQGTRPLVAGKTGRLGLGPVEALAFLRGERVQGA